MGHKKVLSADKEGLQSSFAGYFVSATERGVPTGGEDA